MPTTVVGPLRPRDVWVSPGATNKYLYMTVNWPRTGESRSVYAYPLDTYDSNADESVNRDSSRTFAWSSVGDDVTGPPVSAGLQGIDGGTNLLLTVLPSRTSNVDLRAYAIDDLNQILLHVTESRGSFIDILRRINYVPRPAGVAAKIVEE